MMTITRLAASVLLVTVPTAVQAQQANCISPKQATSLAAYAMPSVLTGTMKRCSSKLTADSYLKTQGDALVTRYSSQKGKTWPAAKAAFLKLSQGKDQASKVLGQLPDDTLREMIDVILEGMISQEIPLSDCGKIDTFARLLAPLPPENTAELIALTVGLATASKPARADALSICKG